MIRKTLALLVGLLSAGCLSKVEPNTKHPVYDSGVVSDNERDAGDVPIRDVSNFCRDGMVLYQQCGVNGNGLRRSYCVGSGWSGFGDCEDNYSCVSGSEIIFYNADVSTLGVGECKEGVLSCAETLQGFKYVVSIPEVLPRQEFCNEKDDDCDGLTDEEGCQVIDAGYDASIIPDAGFDAGYDAAVQQDVGGNFDAGIGGDVFPDAGYDAGVDSSVRQDDAQRELNLCERILPDPQPCSVCGEEGGMQQCSEGVIYCSSEIDIRNGGFEYQPGNNIPCWNVNAGGIRVFHRDENYGLTCDGNQSVRSPEGNSQAFDISQLFNVMPNSLEVNSGLFAIRVSGLFNDSQDAGSVFLKYLGNDAIPLGEFLERLPLELEGCQPFSFETVIPVGTKYVEIHLRGENGGGNTNNATFDDIRIEYHQQHELR